MLVFVVLVLRAGSVESTRRGGGGVMIGVE